jgi:hypothetical protein
MNDEALPPGQLPDREPLAKAPAEFTDGERLLWLGDRVPDFVLPDPQGELRYFYEGVTGSPVVLVLAANTARDDQWDEIKGFAALAPALHEAGADLMIVSNDGTESLAIVSQVIPEHARWLADIKGVVNVGLRTGALFPFTGVVCFVLDGNQRIVAVRGPEPGQAEWALAALKARPRESAHGLCLTAPVMLLPGILDSDDCGRLLNLISRSGPANGFVPVEDADLAAQIHKTLLRRIGPEVEKAFAFDDFAIEALALRWNEGALSGASDCRREITDPAVQGRSFSLILDLASEAYEGGDIRFPEYGPHVYRPGTGGGLVYSGTLLRELRPVSTGRRSLLTAVLRRAPKAADAGS